MSVSHPKFKSVVPVSVNYRALPRTLAKMKYGKQSQCETREAVTPQILIPNVSVLKSWQRTGLSRNGGYVQVPHTFG